MRLICTGRYKSSLGSYVEGQDVDVNDEVAELLLRDSPGSFRRESDPAPEPVAEPEPEAVEETAPEEPDFSAMSTETETGIVAPDRRARGGRRRR